jgi:hypothetical protein
MTPLTAAQVAKAKRSWQAVLAMESPGGQVHAVAFWAARWAEPLLAAAEVLTSLQDAVRVPISIGHPPQPAQDPAT